MWLKDDLETFSLALMGIIMLIILYAFIGSLFEHKHFHMIHETGVGIIIGFLFGVIMYFAHDVSEFEFNQEIFFYALLPPMIFAGGYNLKKKKFFQNFLYIALFGVVATILCFGIMFSLTYLINQLGYIRRLSNFNQSVKFPLSLIVKFSATICASDAVAALTIIKPQEFPKLFSIVFGEGLVNDAVAIILFKVVGDIFTDASTSVQQSLADDQKSTAQIILGIIGGFLLNVISSLGIGSVCALGCSKLFQKCRFLVGNPVIQVVVLYSFGILSYVIAEVVQMSGVITVLVCGIVLAHFNFYNLSITGQLSTGITFQAISFIAESFVFIYLGLSTMFYVQQSQFSFTFVLLELIICAFARLVALFGLSFLVKIFYKKWNVSNWELLIVTVAGIIRGSVAFALILTIKNDEKDIAINIAKSSVLLLVFITTIFLGAIMPKFIEFCLSRDTSQPQNKKSIEASLIQDKQVSESQKSQKQGKQRGFFKMFDEDYLKPFFIYNYRYRKEEIKNFKRMLKMNSSEFKGGQFIALMKTNARQTIVEMEHEDDRKQSILGSQSPSNMIMSSHK